MPSYEWITHNGARILYMDIASDTQEELDAIVSQLKPVIAAEPKRSVRCLVNVAGGRFNDGISRTLQDFTRHNEPYVLMSAVIGINGLQMVLYNGILAVSGRKNLVLKRSHGDALDFLASA